MYWDFLTFASVDNRTMAGKSLLNGGCMAERLQNHGTVDESLWVIDAAIAYVAG
jgi:hypothetical protein